MTVPWSPLSERGSSNPALRDGVPPILERPLRSWVLQTAAGNEHLIQRVAVRCDLVLCAPFGEIDVDDVAPAVRLASRPQADQLLDVVDALLDLLPTAGWRVPPPGKTKAQQAAILLTSQPDNQFRRPLHQLLFDARSLYEIRRDGRGLVRRIDPAVGAVVEAALAAADQPDRGSASQHLRRAVDSAYALTPDPVRAYSEAIKAVEAAVHITLQPKHTNATLGTLLGELRQVRAKVSVPIAGPAGTEGVEALERLTALLWTGQTSRHGGLTATREETVEEALMAVHLAALLVQLFASGAVRRS